MEIKILEYLNRIEMLETIHILYACESGSRMWNIAFEDSDYDVRFIYHRFPQDYICLNPITDVIDINNNIQKHCNIDGTIIERAKLENIDIVGWDIIKYFQLLAKSNSVCFEWLNSPIKYKINDYFNNNFINCRSDCYFQFKQIFHSYLGLARSNTLKYLKSEKVQVKKYLYSIRPILICKWMLENQDAKQVPIDFNILKELLDPKTQFIVDSIMLNRSAENIKLPRIERLDYYINFWIAELIKISKENPIFTSYGPKSALLGLNMLLYDIIIKGR